VKRPTFDELRMLARGAVEAVELANPGFGVIVILQEPVDPANERHRTVAQSNVADQQGAELCEELGRAWAMGGTF
jgi:hypothetical protein